MKLIKNRRFIFAFLAMLFLIAITTVTTPKKNKNVVSAAMTTITPGPAATYYGSQMRLYFHNFTGNSANDLDINFWGWYPPCYYLFPWWYCYNDYINNPSFQRITFTYSPVSPYYPHQPMSRYRWWNGSFPSGNPLYFGWWIYWPRLPVVSMRWSRNGIPYGSQIPIIAYEFNYLGPWQGFTAPPSYAPTTALSLKLSNDQNSEDMTFDMLQTGFSNKMYQLQDLTWDKLSSDNNIHWTDNQNHMPIAAGTMLSFPSTPASDVGMIFRGTLYLNSNPSQMVEYILQYTTGAWSTEFPYRATDVVTYGDTYYKCLYNHTSSPGLEPPNAPAYWAVMSPAPSPPALPSPPPVKTRIRVTPGPTPSAPTPTTTPTPTITPVPTGGENLALHKPITANNYNQAHIASNANDGDVTTYWEGAADSYPNILTIDLGSIYSIGSINIRLNPDPIWSSRRETVYISGSADNVTYTVIRGQSCDFSSYNHNSVSLVFAAVTTRYVQLSFTENTGASAGQAAEVEVFSSDWRATPLPTKTVSRSPSITPSKTITPTPTRTPTPTPSPGG